MGESMTVQKRRLRCLIGWHAYWVRSHSVFVVQGGYVMLRRCYHCGKENPRGGL